jgi:multidrug efflux system membrane fusion protein
MMRKILTRHPTALAALLAIGLFLMVLPLGCGQEQGAPRQFLPQVTVAPVIQRSVPLYLDFVGNLKATEEVEIRARVEGYLVKRAFVDGADVKKGDLLFVIDPQEYEAELARAQAQLARDQASLAYARSQVRRYTPLTEQDLAAKDTLDNFRTLVKERQGSVKGGVAAVKLARMNLGYCTIRAPLSGRIGRRLVDVGNLVGAGEETLLATITQMDPIYVYFNPSERQLPQITQHHQQGKLKVTLMPPGGGVYSHAGKLDFIDNRVNMATGTITMRAVIPNPEKRLIPGQYANVRLFLTENPEALLVPLKAVGADQAGSYVFVIGSDNIAEQRYVQTSLQKYEGMLLVEKGLKEGEQVVVQGMQRIRPGMKVELKSPAPAAGSPKASSGG